MKALEPFPHALLLRRLSGFALLITLAIAALLLAIGWALQLNLEELPWRDYFYTPILFWLFLTWIFYDSCLLAWRRGRKMVSRNRAVLVGNVKDSAAVGRDFFCWWYGLRSIRVDLGNSQESIGYLSALAARLEPGAPVRLHRWGSYMGRERYVAEQVAMRHSLSRDGH